MRVHGIGTPVLLAPPCDPPIVTNEMQSRPLHDSPWGLLEMKDECGSSLQEVTGWKRLLSSRQGTL